MFSLLDANSIRYCILRNYDNIFDDATSDIDLLVAAEDLIRFKEALHLAAARANHRFVHRARYVNYSYVFWNTESSFLRIDFETEVRWRTFPILSADSIMGLRQRHEGFFIPHPCHESVILFLAAIWRNSLSERYRQQLARLYMACPDKEQLRQTYLRAFGGIGNALVEFHAQIQTGDFEKSIGPRLRSSIYRNSVLRPGNLRSLIAHIFADTQRLWERVRNPAGISLLFASAAGKDRNFDDLMQKIEFLFPIQKCTIETFDLTNTPQASAQLGLGLRLKRLRTLFKGGLFVRFYHVASDTDLQKVVKTHTRFLYPSRTFVCMEDSQQHIYLAHVSTGFMTDSSDRETDTKNGYRNLLIEFISTVLGRSGRPDAKHGRGTFAVLIGLDGSGKTTLARNISRLAPVSGRFDGVRYFHWRPKIINYIEFPLPEFRNVPRKHSLPKSWITSFFSALRLAKNILIVNLAYYLRVRPLLRRNYLIVIDRYFYNYYIDPVSVKYYGPAWLLIFMTRCFPKPDAIISLSAGPDTLLQRKQELTPEQIAQQSVIKEKMHFGSIPCFAVDARQAPQAVAQTTLAALTTSPGSTGRIPANP
ncbi:MAG: Thymidylate kinaselike protein [Pedosphaera sp.]|nr:Thymidylate kinaselike protein [Pedosphaera sp.]